MSRPTVTWGDMKAWAEANGITDDHKIVSQDGRWDQRRIVDLSETTTERGEPAFLVQHIYG